MKSLWLSLMLMLLLMVPAQVAADSPSMDPVRVSSLEDTLVFERTLYSLSTRFSSSDTLLLNRLVPRLSVQRIDSVGPHRMVCWLMILPGFVDFGQFSAVVLDSRSRVKCKTQLPIHYAGEPRIDRVTFSPSRQHSGTDTLTLESSGRTITRMTIEGHGLFASTTVSFDDPAIQVLDSPSWRSCNPPNHLTIGLEIDTEHVQSGSVRYRLQSPYAQSAFSTLVLRRPGPPRVFNSFQDVIADGSQHRFILEGDSFDPAMTVSLLPSNGFARVRVSSLSQATVSFELPVLEKSRFYRFVLTNPDGQSDTTRTFFARAVPSSNARVRFIEDGTLFIDTPTRVAFRVEVRGSRKLYPHRNYFLDVADKQFDVSVINDSTFESVLRIPFDSDRPVTNQFVFSVHQRGRPPQWRGVLNAESPPRVDYVSPNRVIHPGDTLRIVLKGQDLEDISTYIDDPAVQFSVLENRGDFVRLQAIAEKQVSPGSYPLYLRSRNVSFRFSKYQIMIRPWQPFSDYIDIRLSDRTQPLADSLWHSSAAVPIQRNDLITIHIHPHRIRPELGHQKVKVSGVLMDSSNTIRAEAYNQKLFEVTPGTGTLTWKWRVRERIKSGDRIEIILENTQRQNRSSRTFFVRPHWSEAFRGSTSFVLFKLPLGEGNTELLKSIGIGISYRPPNGKQFIEYDASFLLGNVSSNNENLQVQVGFGISAIFWKHLQLGVGTDLTGSAFQSAFFFAGTRFNVPIWW